MKLHRLLLASWCILLTIGCNKEDDLEGIFAGKIWHLAGFYSTTDWDNPNMGTPINDYNSHNDLTAYNIELMVDGIAVVTLPEGCQLQGRWEADGKNRTFSFSEWKTVTGDPKRLTKFGKQMYDELLKVSYYQGDSNYIRLFDGSRRYFMQFGDLSKFKK
ncbi:MAG: DUF4847 domain-containing protein [Bacteroidales bacterium]|nr:DUF4847 domain-containing protein [Bacteroidales bacterium]